MSRGRKANSKNQALNWQELFDKNVGKYLQIICIELSKKKSKQVETGYELLEAIKRRKEQLTNEGKLRKEKEFFPINDEEIPFNIPENWVWCRLGEIGISQTGRTPPTTDKKNFGKDIPFIKPADITLKCLILDNEGLSISGLKEGIFIPKNSLLMVCIGGSIGKSYFNEVDVSCNQQINTINPLLEIQAKFLHFWGQSEYFQKSIWAKASGGTIPIVNATLSSRLN